MMVVLTAIGKFFASIWDFYWNKMTLKAKLVMWIAILILIVLGYIVYLRASVSSLEQEVQESNANGILKNDNTLANEGERLRNEANKLADNSNRSANELANSLERDTNQSSNDQRTTDERFCRKFCRDSTCAEWRKNNACP